MSALSPILPTNNPPIVFIKPNFQIHAIIRVSDVHGYLAIARVGLSINVSRVSSSDFHPCFIAAFSVASFPALAVPTIFSVVTKTALL